MASIRELDRPATTYHYAKWGRDVIFRPLAARDMLRFRTDWAELHGAAADGEDKTIDPETMGRFYAELLEMTVEDPAATADEWLAEADFRTLVDLGMEALRVAGLTSRQLAEEKKTSSDPLPASATT